MRNSFNDRFPLVEVHHVFSSYERKHLYADLYSALSLPEFQFQRFLQMLLGYQPGYHRFNGQDRERLTVL